MGLVIAISVIELNREWLFREAGGGLAKYLVLGHSYMVRLAAQRRAAAIGIQKYDTSPGAGGGVRWRDARGDKTAGGVDDNDRQIRVEVACGGIEEEIGFGDDLRWPYPWGADIDAGFDEHVAADG